MSDVEVQIIRRKKLIYQLPNLKKKSVCSTSTSGSEHQINQVHNKILKIILEILGLSLAWYRA